MAPSIVFKNPTAAQDLTFFTLNFWNLEKRYFWMQKSKQGWVLRFSSAFAKVQTSQEETQWCRVNKQGSNIDITGKAVIMGKQVQGNKYIVWMEK